MKLGDYRVEIVSRRQLPNGAEEIIFDCFYNEQPLNFSQDFPDIPNREKFIFTLKHGVDYRSRLAIVYRRLESARLGTRMGSVDDRVTARIVEPVKAALLKES